MISAFPRNTRFHFIGVAGIGMSALAEILLSLGYQVSGSDLSSNDRTLKLNKLGASIFKGHSAHQVEGADVIVYSSAIAVANPEWSRGVELSLPKLKRGELLALLLNQKKGIAIAGSHGKTTTSSLVTSILVSARRDPTYIIGGIINHLDGNAGHGKSDLLIAEADESDGSFLYLRPHVIALTNIDNDHLDYYGSKEKIVEAFQEFVDNLPSYGTLILNRDDKTTLELKNNHTAKWYSYSTDPAAGADYLAQNLKFSANGSDFQVIFQGEIFGEFSTHLLGEHNVANSLAAIATAHQQGLTSEEIAAGLLSFKGVGRRLEKIWEQESFLIIDDYGHHPTEIKATISALKSIDKRPLCVVFEPHRFTRTNNFWEEFKLSFQMADEIYISPIYAASEGPIPGITSERLCQEMNELGMNVKYMSDLDEMRDLLRRKQNTGEIFLTLGAGPISRRIREMVKDL